MAVDFEGSPDGRSIGLEISLEFLVVDFVFLIDVVDSLILIPQPFPAKHAALLLPTNKNKCLLSGNISLEPVQRLLRRLPSTCHSPIVSLFVRLPLLVCLPLLVQLLVLRQPQTPLFMGTIVGILSIHVPPVLLGLVLVFFLVLLFQRVPVHVKLVL